MVNFMEAPGLSEGGAVLRRYEAHVDLLFRHAWPAVIGGLVAAAFLVGGMWDRFHTSVLLGWLGIYGALQVPRLFILWSAEPFGVEAPGTIPRARRFVTFTFLSASMWGLAGLLFFSSASTAHLMFLAIVIAGVCSAGSVAYAPVTGCYVGTILIILTPIGVRFFAEGTGHGIAIGCCIVLYAVVLLTTAANTHETIRTSIGLRFDNEELITLLTDEKEKVEILNRGLVQEVAEHKSARRALNQARNELEARVHERTVELIRSNERLCKEVEERKQTEKALRESQAGYRMLFDNAPLGIITCDREGKVLEANSAMLAVMRFPSPKQLAEMNLLTDPIYASSGIADDVGEVLESGKGKVSEHWCRPDRDDRIKLRVNIVPVRDQEWGIVGAQGIVEDITAQVRFQEELREGEARFRAVFENAQDLMFVKNTAREYTHVNSSMLETLGFSLDKVQGFRDDHIFSPEEAKHIDLLEHRVLEGDTVEAEYTITSGGLPVTLNWIRFALKDRSGAVLGICGIGRDVTARQKQEPSTAGQHQYHSPRMSETHERIRLAAESNSIVLFLGESGSGKDYWARRLHLCSKRSGRPFLAVNCAALSAQLVESELFGHEKGAFTGALRRKRGILELADGGTLLLNEMGELPLQLQAKLLTFLDTGSFFPVGGEKNIKVDVRIVAATNRDLLKEVEAGTFRGDLFYRLNVFSITIPPLSERREDIPGIVEHLLEMLTKRLGLPAAPKTDVKAMRMLLNHAWPGNVRELRNALERAMIVGDKVRIMPGDLGLPVADEEVETVRCHDGAFAFRLANGFSMAAVLREAKTWMLEQALTRSGGRVDEAANMLGISRDSMKHHMKTLRVRRNC
ncbi:MAG: sigma 54-interacting transcriptional regulator [Pseudomonadota bacterium]